MRRLFNVISIFIVFVGVLIACGSKTNGIWPMAIMVGGQIYFCYDEVIEVEADGVEILGHIESTVEMKQGPKQDNQANFPTCMNQPYGRLGERMLIYYDDNWHVCYLTAEDSENKGLTSVPYSIKIESIEMEKGSTSTIGISWQASYDDVVDNYIIKRRNVEKGQGIGEWTIIATIASDKILSNGNWYYIDELDSDVPQQYEYRIDMELIDTEDYIAEEGKNVFGSNIKICIDPGHYHVATDVAEADEFGYIEGDFVLELALELRDVLHEKFGIDSCLTRETDSITLGGYTDFELDSAHISLRGEYAAEEDCDLFVSLHTNSNEEYANGYPTFFQPLGVNKPIIFVNSVALDSETAIEIANATGTKLAGVNFELGLAETDAFMEVPMGEIEEIVEGYNDSADEIGTVVIRKGKKDPDYYGVLRGATNVGIPGMIIEHGHHSVQEVRKAAICGDLKEVWANADAVGIAYGFGFTE